MSVVFSEFERKKLILRNIKRDWNLDRWQFEQKKKDSKYFSFSFRGQIENCGDLLEFLLRMSKQGKIEEIIFNNSSSCIISSSSTNIIISWILSEKPEITLVWDLLQRMKEMIETESFSSPFCSEIAAFREIKRGGLSRINCFLLTIWSFEKMIKEISQ